MCFTDLMCCGFDLITRGVIVGYMCLISEIAYVYLICSGRTFEPHLPLISPFIRTLFGKLLLILKIILIKNYNKSFSNFLVMYFLIAITMSLVYGIHTVWHFECSVFQKWFLIEIFFFSRGSQVSWCHSFFWLP